MAGIGLGVAGVATGNPGLIVAGASVLGSDVSAEGAKKSSEQLVASTEQARAESNARYDATRNEQRGVYERGASGFSPYMNLGASVVPTLGSMVGQTSLPQAPGVVLPSAAPAAAMPTVPTLGAMAQTPVMAAPDLQMRSQQQASQYGKNPDRAEQAPVREQVLIQAPDGERRYVPRRLADKFVARGAQVVG